MTMKAQWLTHWATDGKVVSLAFEIKTLRKQSSEEIKNF